MTRTRTATRRWRVDDLRLTTLHLATVSLSALDPLVLVPGLALSGRTLLPVVPELARFADVWVVDLPGSGGSRRPPRRFDVDDHARAVLRWCEVAGLERVTLLGHSVGSQFALAAAELAPDRVAALVLSAPTGDPQAASEAVVARWLADGLREPPQQVPGLVRDWLRADPLTLITSLVTLQRDDVLARLPRVTCPALVLRGAADVIVPEDWAEDLVRRLPRGRLAVVPGQPHNALTLAPERSAAIVRDFLLAARDDDEDAEAASAARAGGQR
ncbi:MAG: alpha/beta hydrolase [Actinomycetota bacterium]|nr:alpha/beta hydrolase [Actinomycetota bacterium]